MDRNLKNNQIVFNYFNLESKHLSAQFTEILKIKNNLTLNWEEINKKSQNKPISMINLQRKNETFKRKSNLLNSKSKPLKDNLKKTCKFYLLSQIKNQKRQIRSLKEI